MESNMANDAEARSVLKDVALTGTVTIPKRKLLWLVGWVHDKPGAWNALLDQRVEIGEQRDSLYGIEIYKNLIVLMKLDNPEHKVQSVSDWAK
jgi:hypothetical protein